MDGKGEQRQEITIPRRDVTARRAVPELEEATQLPLPTRTILMQLVAEVERLEAELAAARAESDQLAARAEEDLLTGLANRRGFEREMVRTLSYIQRYGAAAALLYVDLDGFKGINDRRGHAAGDGVLRTVAESLIGHVRASDRAARLGGDEFALILWNISPEDAERKARAIEEMIATLPGTSGELGASVGVTILSADDTPAIAEARADRAMYIRKAARSAER